MRSSKDLTVKPVKRYRKPKYPSHQDPDPTLDTNVTPYPLSTKVVSTLAAMATVVSASCSSPENQSTDAGDGDSHSAEVSSTSPQSESTKPNQQTVQRLRAILDQEAKEAGVPARPINFSSLLYAYEKEQGVDRRKEINEHFKHSMGAFGELPESQPIDLGELRENEFRNKLITEAGGNPFCVAVSGLPHQTSPYGTGVPNYVEADFARRVIEKVFSDAGYTMQQDVQYDDNGVAFSVDGYDAEKKVGFVVGGWGNLDNDALVHWHLMRSGDDDDFSAQASSLEQSLNYPSASDSDKQIVRDIQAARKQPDLAKRSAAFKSILDRYSKSMLSLEEIEELESRALEGSDFIAVISTFDQRFIRPWNVQLDDQERKLLKEEFKKTNDLDSPDENVNYRELVRKEIAKKKVQVRMAELEKAAREYIQWAKTQGLQ